MQFTPAERLILLMLCQISKKLGVEGDIDHAFVEKAISENADWAVSWKYQAFDEPSRPKEDIKFVGDILTMARVIEDGYAALEASGKALVDAAVKNADKVYSGFDGNGEANYRAIADFMIDGLGRYPEFSGRYSNSHAPMAAIYERRLATYRDNVKADFQKISPRQIIAVLTS